MLLFLFSFLSTSFVDNYGVEFDSEMMETLLSTPSSLTEYTVPAPCTTISGGTYETSSFRACRTAIKKLDFAQNSQLSVINSYLLQSSSIESINFSNCKLIKTLPSYFCSHCAKLTTLILPPNIESIGYAAFRSTSSLDKIEFPISLKTLYSYAFQHSKLTYITIPYESKLESLYNDCLSSVHSKSFFLPENFKTFAGASFVHSLITNITIHPKNTHFTFDGKALFNKDKTALFFTVEELEEITYPSSLKNIFASAIRSTNLKTITFSGPIESIDDYGIAQNNNLISFDFPEGISVIPSYAMRYCKTLETVTFPNSVTTISKYAFDGCTMLQNIILHEGIATIETGAFQECISLLTLDLPASLVTLEAGVFTKCSNLEINGTRNKNIAITDGMLFVNEKKQLNEYFGENKTIKIPSYCTILGKSAFVGTPVEEVSFAGTNKLVIQESVFFETNLKKITFPSSLSSLGQSCFESCTKLLSIDLSNTQVTSIPPRCFYECNEMTAFIPPKLLKVIDEYSFYSCSSLLSFDFTKTAIYNISNYAFQFSNLKENEVQFPSTLKYLGYSSFEYCQIQTLKLDQTAVTLIPLRAFAVNQKLTTLLFNNNNLQEIGDEAFYGCIGLVSFQLPYSVITLDPKCFYGCTSLKSVHFSTNCLLETVRGQAFGNCPLLETIDIPENDKKFKFKNYMLFDASMKSIFLYLSSNPSAICLVPALVEEIQQYAFEDCSNIQQLFIADGVLTTIGHMAFKGCSKLSLIYLPSTLSNIGTESFQGCESLKCGSVFLDGNNETIKSELISMGKLKEEVFSTNCYKHQFSCICRHIRLEKPMLFMVIILLGVNE